ncbi:uncharacterized protein LOC130511153 [Raphanus sativus]|uniref:Uncharacterized protein LOC130511153 n=1 Tax=Raphanus sativus TaxID=3726 RepID=A0A9W3DJB7_RAPSA|nr:uncharacterized protein LOC130511153 [Raphanus sativus]
MAPIYLLCLIEHLKYVLLKISGILFHTMGAASYTYRETWTQNSRKGIKSKWLVKRLRYSRYPTLTDFTRRSNLPTKRCWDYLEKIDPRHWTRSHFEGERYNLMSSNIAESLNKALVHARDSPIMALFEFIRCMVSRWFVSRQRKISKISGEIPPAVHEWMENNLEDARAYAVMPLSAFEFEVTLKTNGFGSSVNLETRSCTCLEFQKVGIPCRHAIAAAMFRDLQHSEFVADAYLKKTWNETTKGVTLPVPDPKDIFIPPEVSELIMLPPKTKRPPGRPPTKRTRGAGEIPVSPNLL